MTDAVPAPTPGPLPTRRALVARRRRDLRAMVGDGVAFSAMVGVGESYLPAFVLAAGLGEVSAGLVATVPLLAGAMFQLVTPAAVNRLESNRRWVVGCAWLQAASLLPLALGALTGHVTRFHVFASAAAYWGFGMATNPAWNTWVGALVPRRLRARFFAHRNRWCQAALFLSVTGAGALLHYGERQVGSLEIFAVLFALAAGARVVSARFLAAQSEPRPFRPDTSRLTALGFVRRLGVSDDGRLLASLLVMHLAVYVAAPFFTPYMLGPLGLSYGGFTALTAAAFLARIAALPLLGRLAHRWGAKRVLWLGALGIVPLPSLWLISDAFVYLLVLQLCAGTAWAAFELAALLSFFEHIDERERTRVLSYFNLANALALVGGSLIGSALFESFDGGRSAYAALFLVSSGARIGTLVLLRRARPAEPSELAVPVRTLTVRPSLGAEQQPVLPSLPTSPEPTSLSERPGPT